MSGTDFYRAGADAWRAGAPRLVPRGILVDHGADAARAWYRGWDSTNLAAPLPEGDDR